MALHSAEQNIANKQQLSTQVWRNSHSPRNFADQSSPSPGGVLHPRRARKHFGNMGTRARERAMSWIPSFGGCAFLNAATTILASRGVSKPGERVFGVDVDPMCMEYVRKDQNLVEKNCIIRDFLSLSPKDISGAPFHTIIGNPPYVRHHWFNGTTRKAGRVAMAAAGVALPETASAWAYFLIHTLSFIAKNGRLAMLVPEAIFRLTMPLSSGTYSHLVLITFA